MSNSKNIKRGIKIMCLFMGHEWKYTKTRYSIQRKCLRCDLKMDGSYDPMYGTTEWNKNNSQN